MNGKHIIVFFLSGVLLFAATGCKKYLQIQPQGSYTEIQVFANEQAAQSMLNGLYISMADNNLYGAALTQTTIELMAQRYKTTSSGAGAAYIPFQLYQYTTEIAQTGFDDIWQKAYSTILTANLFLLKIDQSVQSGVLTQAHSDLMKGEALAVRAMLHFDMMRLFSSVYSLGADQPAIPYYTLADGKAQPIISSAQVLDKVLADLDSAAGLLASDAIIQKGVDNLTDFYTGSRNQRLNYYAVKALKARACLWGGRNAEAHDAALAVLNEGEKWFPWLAYSAIIGTDYPDRIFSTEMLFGVYNRNLYTNYTSYFSPNLLDEAILTAEPTNLKNTFEDNENDYRYTTTWVLSTKTYPTFYKYDDLTTIGTLRFLQPLIRKSELYYILAETDTDPSVAPGYLNIVRKNRGLQPVDASASLPAEILKEYRKEFYGEGQLFFYYKRTNTATVPDGVTNAAIKPVYVVPLPISETTPR